MTQHFHVWRIIHDACPTELVPAVSAALLRRQVSVMPHDRDAIILLCDTLIASGQIDEAAYVLRYHVYEYGNGWKDTKKKSNKCNRDHNVVVAAADILRISRPYAQQAVKANHRAVPDLNRAVSSVDSTGPVAAELETCLAEFHARRGDFERARMTLEQAVTTAHVVRDFSVIFDAYAQLETTLADASVSRGDASSSLQVARLSRLVDKRPMLLSDVQLRQNQHNVHAWLHRARLFIR